MNLAKLRFWIGGVRLYIAAATILVTLEVWWWASVTYGSSNLATIRLQEIYAWLALALVVLALAIGPAYKVFPALPGKFIMRDARRLIGVSAAWFATLHAAISYGGLFQFPNPLSLATVYQQALGLGAFGLLVLLLMAFTSFDKAFTALGPWWFRLHRFVYLAALAALMHALMIGAHAGGLWTLVVLGLASVGLLTLHTIIIVRSVRPTKLQVITITCLVLLLLAILNYGLTQYLGYNFFLAGHEDYQ